MLHSLLMAPYYILLKTLNIAIQMNLSNGRIICLLLLIQTDPCNDWNFYVFQLDPGNRQVLHASVYTGTKVSLTDELMKAIVPGNHTRGIIETILRQIANNFAWRILSIAVANLRLVGFI